MSYLAEKMNAIEDAWAKSFILLMENLSPLQCRTIENFGYIPVEGSDGSQWIVLPATVQNAYDVTNDQMWCMTMADREIPPGDVILGVVLSIQDDVEDFRATASDLDSKSWMYSAMNSQAYVSTHHLSALAQTYLPWRQEEMRVADKEWQDYLCCHDEVCNNIDKICDFHRGSLMMLSLINDGSTFRATRQVSSYLIDGVAAITRIMKKDSFDLDLFRLLFTEDAEMIVNIFADLVEEVEQEKEEEKALESLIVNSKSKRFHSLVTEVVAKTYGPAKVS